MVHSESQDAPAAPAGLGEVSTLGTFPIVGIGASAGGLEALEALVRRLSPDGMAFVVVQHLRPGHESKLAEILAHADSLRVETVRDGARVEPDTLYVTPPDTQLSIEHGAFQLARLDDGVPTRSIDTFFRTLARDAGPRSIGVLLSGAGSDGALGLCAIKEHGGLTFVQEPSTAVHASMPEAAIRARSPDFCLGPEAIADELMRVADQRGSTPRRTPRHVVDPRILARLFDRLRTAYRVDFSGYKLANVERCVAQRMARQKLESADDYAKLVESSSDELALLYDDLLVGATGFFRDAELFEALERRVFPRLFEGRAPENPVRVWVPGCATGEEAYSIAICLLEYLHRGTTRFPIMMFGSDLDEKALARARHGHYPRSIERAVSAERLRRFFIRDGNGYQVSRELREMVVFAHQITWARTRRSRAWT